MSLFVSFEGGEGAGKSTQAQMLADRLRAAGAMVVFVKEPGTTDLGKYLRSWLKREYRREDAVSELFLFAAARAELVATVIRPALRRSDAIVVTDRYADSTTAYQGYGRRLPLAEVEAVNRLATGGITPDVTFLLDCPPERGVERFGSAQLSLRMGDGERSDQRRLDPEGARRFEQESLEFHRRVRRGYLEMAEREPGRWCMIDAALPAEEIADIVWMRVSERLRDRAPGSAGDLELRPQAPEGAA